MSNYIKIFLSGLFHETHTFLDKLTRLEAFHVKHGKTIRDCQGDSSPIGGILELLAQNKVEVVLGTDYRAAPSGIVEDAVLESFWKDLENAWDPDVDGVFLVLHGAMVTESHKDVEGEILQRIRKLPEASKLPVFGVYDLHANFTPVMAKFANGLIAYRENPHTDARESAVRAASLMLSCLQNGEVPSMVYRSTGLVWEPTETGTADVPMASLEELARKLEEENDSVLAANINGGFAYANSPYTGVSFQIITTDQEKSSPLLDQLEEKAQEVDALAKSPALPIDDVFQIIHSESCAGLTLLIEPSDNIGGGAPGDGTGLLRKIVEVDLQKVAICINDPAAVEFLRNTQIGEVKELAIGGRGSRFDPGPLTLSVELVSQNEGRFRLEDSKSHLASMHGDYFEMGPCAVVRHRGITILLTSNKTPPFDLGQWRSQRIEPTSMKYIVVKGAVAHRRAYDPITARSFWVDTPGPCRMENAGVRK